MCTFKNTPKRKWFWEAPDSAMCRARNELKKELQPIIGPLDS
jgi:hypothetical protein